MLGLLPACVAVIAFAGHVQCSSDFITPELSSAPWSENQVYEVDDEFEIKWETDHKGCNLFLWQDYPKLAVEWYSKLLGKYDIYSCLVPNWLTRVKKTQLRLRTFGTQVRAVSLKSLKTLSFTLLCTHRTRISRSQIPDPSISQEQILQSSKQHLYQIQYQLRHCLKHQKPRRVHRRQHITQQQSPEMTQDYRRQHWLEFQLVSQ